MEDVFIINPSADDFDIKDEIGKKLAQAEAVINCLSAGGFGEDGKKLILSDEIVAGVLWTVSDLLREIKILRR